MKQRKNWRIRPRTHSRNFSNKLGLLALAVLLMNACNPSTSDTDNEPEEEAIAVVNKSTSYATVDTLSVIASGADMSEMRFDIDTLYLKRGTDITIGLINNSTDASMPHNLVIINEGEANSVGQNGLKFKDNDFVQPDDNHVIAHSPLVQIGDTAYFSFKAPEDGNYEFICSFPGHWGIMKGKVLLTD